MSTKKLAFLTVVVSYILIVFGGYVASSQSGMGCGPDWPLCNGVLVPVLKGATLVEYTHRVIGAILAVLALVLFIRILRENTANKVKKAAVWMISLLVVQILLGAVVVFYDTPAIIVSIHLLIAMTYLAILIFIWRRLGMDGKEERVQESHNSKIHFNILIVLLFLTLGLGAYIKHQSFGLACDWLSCRESFLPVSGPELFQTLHRTFAVGSAVYILLLTFLSFSRGWKQGIQKRLLLGSLTVLAQLAAGVLAIITNLALSWAVIHLALATLLFAIIIEARVEGLFKTSKSRKNYNASSEEWHHLNK